MAIYIYRGKQNMKKQIYVFFCTMIIIVFPCVTGLIITNTLEEIKNLTVEDDAPVWELHNLWTYNVNRFQVNFFSSGALIGLDSSLDNFIVELIGLSESSYILKLSGRIKGYFQYDSGEGIVLKGNLLYTKVSGNLYLRQNDLAIEKLIFVIKGIVLLTENPLQIPIPIPIPLTITINVNQSTPRPFIDFPLYDGKQGLINETSITANIKFESIVLQILSLFIYGIPNEFFIEETLDIPMIDYLAESENISVGAGTFDAYNIKFAQDLFGSVYYAPSAGNFVKAEAVIEIPDHLQEESNRPCKYAYTFCIEI